jgi:hypothetical protein
MRDVCRLKKVLADASKSCSFRRRPLILIIINWGRRGCALRGGHRGGSCCDVLWQLPAQA